MKKQELKRIAKKLKNLFTEKEDRRAIIEKMTSEDFTVDTYDGEYRFIHEDSIDKIQREELASDPSLLGCFSARFIVDITGLSLSVVERAQKNESFELLGELMLQHIDEVQDEYSSIDGYGHHFSPYDGNEYNFGEYYAFRIN